MIHKLKIQSEYLSNLMAGKKKAEVRFNDRDYQRGDVLEFDFDDSMHEDGHEEATRSVHFKVTHIHTGLGLQPGYVVLSVRPMEHGEVCVP